MLGERFALNHGGGSTSVLRGGLCIDELRGVAGCIAARPRSKSMVVRSICTAQPRLDPRLVGRECAGGSPGSFATPLPVVATAVDGVPDLVADCGLLIPPRTPDAAANASAEFDFDHTLRDEFVGRTLSVGFPT